MFRHGVVDGVVARGKEEVSLVFVALLQLFLTPHTASTSFNFEFRYRGEVQGLQGTVGTAVGSATRPLPQEKAALQMRGRVIRVKGVGD